MKTILLAIVLFGLGNGALAADAGARAEMPKPAGTNWSYMTITNGFGSHVDRRQFKRLRNEGWQVYSIAHRPQFVGGANQPERQVLQLRKSIP